MAKRVKKLHWVFERNVKTEGYFARTPVGDYIVYRWLPSSDLGWFANYPNDDGPNYSSNDPKLLMKEAEVHWENAINNCLEDVDEDKDRQA